MSSERDKTPDVNNNFIEDVSIDEQKEAQRTSA
jgi:hypothetical protein